MENNSTRRSDTLRYLKAIWQPGDIREIRAFNNKGFVTYGYFDSPEKADKEIQGIIRTHEIYVTLNPCNPALLARARNRLKIAGKKDKTTSDKDIEALRYLLVDCDPQRPSGISSTADELRKANETIDRIITDYGIPLMKGMSGNGYHGIFRHNATDPRQIKTFLEQLNDRYGNNGINIDLKVFNPSRITKVLGTYARKGDNTEDRPHRQSYIVSIGETPVVLELPKVQEPVQTKNVQVTPSKGIRSSGNVQHDNITFVRDFLNKHSLIVKEENPYHERGYLFILETCYFDNSHKNGEASVIVMPDGKIIYQCFHDSCSHHTWNELRNNLEGPKHFFCKYCRAEILWDKRNPINLDGTRHNCRRPSHAIEKRTRREDERPVLLLNGDLEIKTQDILSWLYQHNDPPRIFVRGREIVRLVQMEGENADQKEIIMEGMDGRKLRAFLHERIRFVKNGKNQGEDESITETTDLPISVADNILSRSSWALPELMEIIRNPTIAPDGSCIVENGYQPIMQAWVDLGGIHIKMDESPTEQQVQAAKSLILGDLLGDFPFNDDASVAHAVALGLSPFVRHLIHGCIPLYLISAPSPGSGKSLLCEILTMVATGNSPTSLTEGKCEEEWRKRITAVLERSPTVIRIDNVTYPLESAALSSVLTTRVWTDRRLGATAIVTARNNAIWVATANNPVLNMEIARRCVWISLDPQVSEPWKRSGFKHEPLTKWIKENRTSLIKAFFTLIQVWVKQGMPRANIKMGSFEEWAEIMGGILETIGIKGFLANHQKLYSRADSETREWRSFVRIWWDNYQDQPVAVRNLRLLALNYDLLTLLGHKGEFSQRIRLGKALKQKQDRIIDRWRIEEANPDIHSHTNKWKLTQVNEDDTECE